VEKKEHREPPVLMDTASRGQQAFLDPKAGEDPRARRESWDCQAHRETQASLVVQVKRVFPDHQVTLALLVLRGHRGVLEPQATRGFKASRENVGLMASRETEGRREIGAKMGSLVFRVKTAFPVWLVRSAHVVTRDSPAVLEKME
jgi:hypothetical protein